ncbi:MAG TPA: hypothetical protein VMW77_07575 [Methanoregula sp.]|nr:hypothetical protein [Methanoregula sp.]
MLIFDRDGHERGRIMARNELRTTDETLERIWKEQITPLPCREVPRRVKLVIDTLAAHGYRGEPVEQVREKWLFFCFFVGTACIEGITKMGRNGDYRIMVSAGRLPVTVSASGFPVRYWSYSRDTR